MFAINAAIQKEGKLSKIARKSGSQLAEMSARVAVASSKGMMKQLTSKYIGEDGIGEVDRSCKHLKWLPLKTVPNRRSTKL